MGKLLTWIVIGALIWFGFKMLQVSQRRRQDSVRRDGADAREGGDGADRANGGGALAPGERMVRCEHCGVHLPVSDALTAGGHLYCSPGHRDAGPSD